jgi:periplasmic mercuric ion binding protein
MKTIKILIVALLASISAYANNTTHNETITFKVFGNCEMCKERIEKAMKSAGVKTGEWNVDTKMANATFDIHSVGPEDIHKAIAAAGYDTEKVHADDKIYRELPDCCQYERAK